MSISHQRLKCHFGNMFSAFHRMHEQTADDQRASSADPSHILTPARGDVAWLFSFFLGSSGCHLSASCWLLLYVVNIDVMYCRNGQGGGISQGDQESSFICRLPSCLLQVFHKVLRFWHESESQFYLMSSSHFKLHIIHQKQYSAPLRNTDDTSNGLWAYCSWWQGSKLCSCSMWRRVKFDSKCYISNTESNEVVRV